MNPQTNVTKVTYTDDTGARDVFGVELEDPELIQKAIQAFRRGHWPLICWTQFDDPWVITRPTTVIEAVHLLDLQHRRDIQGVIVTATSDVTP